VAALRPHLKTCLSCRARLKAFREAPARVAALVPPAALLAADPDGGPLRGLLESIAGVAQHKAAVLGERVHAAGELATGQKVAAVAASAAALAGGGTAVDRFTNHEGPPVPAAEQVEAKPVAEEQAPGEPAPPEPVAEQQPAPTEPVATPAPAPQPAPPPPPLPDPANEFAPAGAPASASPSPAAQPAQPAGGFTPGGGGQASSGAAGGEFAP